MLDTAELGVQLPVAEPIAQRQRRGGRGRGLPRAWPTADDGNRNRRPGEAVGDGRKLGPPAGEITRRRRYLPAEQHRRRERDDAEVRRAIGGHLVCQDPALQYGQRLARLGTLLLAQRAAS